MKDRDKSLEWAAHVVRDPAEGESVEQTLAALRDEGLIEATGEFRAGRPCYAVTAKGRQLLDMTG
jgi:DNA-binding PadR family transcriptional regulator